MLPLSALPPGASARVMSIDTSDGALRRRFAELGIFPGTAVRCVLRSPLGDPQAYLIRGIVTAIRARDARAIRVRPCGGEVSP